MAVEVLTAKFAAGTQVKDKHENAHTINIKEGHLFVADANGVVAVYAPAHWVSATRLDN